MMSKTTVINIVMHDVLDSIDIVILDFQDSIDIVMHDIQWNRLLLLTPCDMMNELLL